MDTGRHGEKLAAEHLAAAGFAIRARNWRCRYGEIDLVCDDGSTLVFVEVRTVRTTRFGSPEASIGLLKQRSLVRASQIWLQGNPGARGPVRYDVVAVDLSRGMTPQIRHHRGAFDATAMVGEDP